VSDRRKHFVLRLNDRHEAGGELRNIGATATCRDQRRTRLLLPEGNRISEEPWVGVPQPMLQMVLGARVFADERRSRRYELCLHPAQHVPARRSWSSASSVRPGYRPTRQGDRQRDVAVQFHISKKGYRRYLIKNDEFRPGHPITLFTLDPVARSRSGDPGL